VSSLWRGKDQASPQQEVTTHSWFWATEKTDSGCSPYPHPHRLPHPDPEPIQSFRPFALFLRIAVGEGYAEDSLANVSPAPVRGEMFRARRVAGESAPPGELGAARPEADTTTGRSELELELELEVGLGLDEEDEEG
jgi:hypothetical protein